MILYTYIDCKLRISFGEFKVASNLQTNEEFILFNLYMFDDNQKRGVYCNYLNNTKGQQ